MATHGSIGEFVHSQEDWRSYTERLQHYFTANDVENAEKQRAILLSVCSASTYQLIRNLVAPAKPTDKSFADIVALVQEHHHPPLSVTVQHFSLPLPLATTGRVRISICGRAAEVIRALQLWRHPQRYVAGPLSVRYQRPTPPAKTVGGTKPHLHKSIRTGPGHRGGGSERQGPSGESSRHPRSAEA